MDPPFYFSSSLSSAHKETRTKIAYLSRPLVPVLFFFIISINSNPFSTNIPLTTASFSPLQAIPNHSVLLALFLLLSSCTPTRPSVKKRCSAMTTKLATTTNKPSRQMSDETAGEYCERFRRETHPDILDDEVTKMELVDGLLLEDVRSTAKHSMNLPLKFVQLAKHISDISSGHATPPGAPPTAPPTAPQTAPPTGPPTTSMTAPPTSPQTAPPTAPLTAPPVTILPCAAQMWRV